MANTSPDKPANDDRRERYPPARADDAVEAVDKAPEPRSFEQRPGLSDTPAEDSRFGKGVDPVEGKR